MNKDEFILHEWEKEKLDKMVRDNELQLAKEEGQAEGIEQTTETIIKSMMKNKIDYETISKVTNKTIEEIKEIEKSMKK